MWRIEVSKKLENKEPLHEILDNTLEIIALMVGDKAFYDTNIERLNKYEEVEPLKD